MYVKENKEKHIIRFCYKNSKILQQQKRTKIKKKKKENAYLQKNENLSKIY